MSYIPQEDHLSHQLGLAKLEGVSWLQLFGKCLAPHGRDELERALIVGTVETTPALNASMAALPQPWIFLRVFSVALASYLINYWILAVYQQQAVALIPALIVAGSFAVPLSMLTLFFEFNTPKNTPISFLIYVAFLGGAISFLITFWLFDYLEILTVAYGASAAGFVEEAAKILALLVFIRKEISSRQPYLLNGLLLGATVGAGFSAFESAGYALRIGLETNSFALLNANLISRGLLAPFSHIVWSSMAAGAFWLAYKERKTMLSALFSTRFFSLFVLSLLLHFIWNLEIQLPFWAVLLKNVLLGVLAWAVVLRMVKTGLLELSQLARKES